MSLEFGSERACAPPALSALNLGRLQRVVLPVKRDRSPDNPNTPGDYSSCVPCTKVYPGAAGMYVFWGPLHFSPLQWTQALHKRTLSPREWIRLSVERTRLSVLRHAPSSRSRGGQPRHVCPARAPRDHALPLRLPGAERATGVLPQLASVRRGVQLRRPPHHRAVRDGDDPALALAPNM